MNHVRLSIFACLTAALLGTVTIEGTPEEDLAFQRFIDQAMQNYSGWLVENNLDPTPIIPHTIDLTGYGETFNSSGEIKNQVIHNHSKILYWVTEAHADLPGFGVSLQMPNYWTIGEYHVEGFLNGIPFSGSGQSNLTAHSEWAGNPIVYVVFVNFTLTPDGYVDFSTGVNEKLLIADHDGKFENLNLDELDEWYISSELAALYSKQRYDWLPLDQYLTTFLKEVFAQTPFADIIKP